MPPIMFNTSRPDWPLTELRGENHVLSESEKSLRAKFILMSL